MPGRAFPVVSSQRPLDRKSQKELLRIVWWLMPSYRARAYPALGRRASKVRGPEFARPATQVLLIFETPVDPKRSPQGIRTDYVQRSAGTQAG